MKRNALYVQSGGPTAVINASAFGVIQACAHHFDRIGKLYCARHGIIGVLNNDIIDSSSLPQAQIELLPQTPGMAFGSCRYRLPDQMNECDDYERLLATLKKRNIGFVFLNGGNGTLHAARKIHKFLVKMAYDCSVIVIPKTVDNDIECIDHSPGFPSIARHVAITISELAHDIRSYDTGLITLVEVMGRNSGWVAAASMAAGVHDVENGPDLIYVPEVSFKVDNFLHDVREVFERKKRCLIVMAEGVKDENGRYFFEYGFDKVDKPDLNMGGITPYLTRLLSQHFDCKIRGVDLGLMQRCAHHTASPLDLYEAQRFGKRAVEAALSGESGKMVTISRISDSPYETEETLVAIDKAAAGHNPLPEKYIGKNKNSIMSIFLSYLHPLIGDLPEYAKLKIL